MAGPTKSSLALALTFALSWLLLSWPVFAEKKTLMRAQVATEKIPATRVDSVLLEVSRVEQESATEVLAEAEALEENPTLSVADDNMGSHGKAKFETWSQLFQWAVQRVVAENETKKEVPSQNQATGPELSLLAARDTVETPGKAAAAAALVHAKRKDEESRREKEFAETLDAMKTQPSEFDVLSRAIAVLQDPSSDAETRLTAFYTLEELCHNIDNANDLALVGGVEVLANAIVEGSDASSEADATSAALWTLATCTQNNPTVQDKVLQRGVVPHLINLVEKSDEAYVGGQVHARCLLALAALLDGSEKGRAQLAIDPTRSAAMLRKSLVVAGGGSLAADNRTLRRALYIAELLVRDSAGDESAEWVRVFEEAELARYAEELLQVTVDVDVREAAATFLTRIRERNMLIVQT